ncbi:MAG: cysteine-rich small domain-containing protein [Clostridia bacterium]|nr:cysteine-rich small domain-containing protein [Clostridia bacterium]
MEKYKFFQHKECEFFPCHKGADLETFNCLFCFCPLYALGDKCGGNPKYIDDGKGGLCKDCSDCLLPHLEGGYEYIMKKFCEIEKLACEGK